MRAPQKRASILLEFGQSQLCSAASRDFIKHRRNRLFRCRLQRTSPSARVFVLFFREGIVRAHRFARYLRASDALISVFVFNRTYDSWGSPGRHRRVLASSISSPFWIQHADIQSERLQFLDQNLEGLRNTRRRDILSLDNRLVGLDTAGDIVALDGQDLLQRICRAVCLQRPDLHLAETLTAELRLTAERLLRHQASTDRWNARGSYRQRGGGA